MKVVVGLGNPGAQYANTPHSVGFEVVDRIAAECGAAWEEKRQFKCLMTRATLAGQSVLLVKPQTFMNLSGESVAPVVKYHNATAADLLVIQDDIDLAVGKIRIRKAGSCGGHNGIRNIIERLMKEVQLDELVVTDSIPLREGFDPAKLPFKLTQLSVAPLIGEAIRRTHLNESINDLFNHE